jgi:putative nucleotidyltransferase with HDIG domain
MDKLVAAQITKQAQKEIKKLAKANDWLWFYNLHQREVIKYAEKLLRIYKTADREIVLISCWLHDIAHYQAHGTREIVVARQNHHTKGAEIAEKILRQYPLKLTDIAKIKNCVLRHRNNKPYQPRTLEEKIMVVADTMSHFGSIFYFTYFKFHPDHTLEMMVADDLAKLNRDWRDLQLLPAAKKLVAPQYKLIRQLVENYQNADRK